MFKTKKASVLVYSLLILSIMLVIAISISSVSTKNMQSTMTSNKSTQAFQTADSGMELMMKKIKDVEDRTVVTINALGNCEGGKIILSSDYIGKGTAEISFFSVDEDTRESARIDNCGDPLSKIDEIKSIGSYGDTVRAVKMKVAKESSSSEISCSGTIPSGHNECDGAKTELITNGTWKKSSDGCASDVKCRYKEISGPSHSCSGSSPSNSTRCADNGSGAWHYVSTCTGATCGYVCDDGYTYKNGRCEKSGGGGGENKPCTLPWGGTISDGSSVTAYAASSVPCGSTCNSQIRTCNNGVLSGSYTYENCLVEDCVEISNFTVSPTSMGFRRKYNSYSEYLNNCLDRRNDYKEIPKFISPRGASFTVKNNGSKNADFVVRSVEYYLVDSNMGPDPESSGSWIYVNDKLVNNNQNQISFNLPGGGEKTIYVFLDECMETGCCVGDYSTCNSTSHGAIYVESNNRRSKIKLDWNVDIPTF